MKRFLRKLCRGGKIQIIESTEEISKSYIEKSESNLISSKILLDNDRLEESTSLTYYSMYNLVLSLLFKVGIKSENHSASIFLLKEIFDFDNQPILDAKRERIDKQYYTGFEIAKEEVSGGIIAAENFNRNLSGFILGLNNQKIKDFRIKLENLLR